MAPNQGAATAARVVDGQPSAPALENRRDADAAAFGAFLRGQREARHLTLPQIAEITKIAPNHFNSLERGDIRRWPGGMYRRAMVRAYAQAVGLDAEETVRTFVDVFSEEHDDPPVASHAARQPHAQRVAVIRRAASAAGIVGVATVLLLLAWYAASYARAAMQSRAVSTPQPAPAGVTGTVDTAGPASPNGAVTTTGTPAATSGTTNERISIAAALTEGELRVRSDPDGAQVTVNGIGWGHTPVTIKYLPVGDTRVRLTKDGYLSAERRIQITAERPVRALRVTLQPRADND